MLHGKIGFEKSRACINATPRAICTGIPRGHHEGSSGLRPDPIGDEIMRCLADSEAAVVAKAFELGSMCRLLQP